MGSKKEMSNGYMLNRKMIEFKRNQLLGIHKIDIVLTVILSGDLFLPEK